MYVLFLGWGRLRAEEYGAHQGGHATTRFLEGFLEGSPTVGSS